MCVISKVVTMQHARLGLSEKNEALNRLNHVSLKD
ncbi:hypothetical protein ES707_17612 [subsurface metagenome]